MKNDITNTQRQSHLHPLKDGVPHSEVVVCSNLTCSKHQSYINLFKDFFSI